MNRSIYIILTVILIIFTGCSDEEMAIPNPLQVEILAEEDTTPVTGSITGRIIFTNEDKQIQAYPLSSNEYVIFQGTSAKVSGKSLMIYIDFPSNNGIYLMDGGYFHIENIKPGTHEIILTYTDDVLIAAEPGTLPGDNYTKVDVPASHWTVTVEPGRNTATGHLMVIIPELEWQTGKSGEEDTTPQEPEQPTVPNKPTTKLPAGMKSAVIFTTDKVHQQEGGVIQNGNTFVIKAGGNDIWGNADQFTYVYQEMSGDFEFVITVNSLDKTNDWSKAGPMARQNLEPGSINVFAACRGLDDLITFQSRGTANGASASERFTPNGAKRPVTIKLTRQGDIFYGGWSKDGGRTWEPNLAADGVTKTSVVNLKMTDPILLGIAVTSHDEGVMATSEIEVLSAPFDAYAVSTESNMATTWGNIKTH